MLAAPHCKFGARRQYTQWRGTFRPNDETGERTNGNVCSRFRRGVRETRENSIRAGRPCRVPPGRRPSTFLACVAATSSTLTMLPSAPTRVFSAHERGRALRVIKCLRLSFFFSKKKTKYVYFYIRIADGLL